MNNIVNIEDQTELLSIDDQLCYQLKKIMFHNSAAANCFSLKTDKNTLLNGTNGKGKTSKLNAIQIGFLPHTSFKNSDKKYYFVDSEGEHFSDQDCYYYHFPDSNSVIAFEFKNTYGIFTQLVYRGADPLTIERAFLPVSMDDIYDWFWLFSEDDELGTPTKITYQQLISKIKAVKGHRFSKTVQENKKLMFNRTLVDEDAARFSIAPITENKIDNLIDVFKLAVNATSINDKLIKKTVVSLIESTYINNTKDKTDFSPTQLLERFDSLEKDRLVLNNRKNFEDNYKSICTAFSELKTVSNQLDHDFTQLESSTKHFLKNKKAEIEALEVEKTQEKTKKDDFDLKVTGLQSSYDQKIGAFNAKSTQVNRRKPKVEQYQALLFGEDSDLILFNGDAEQIEKYWQDYLDGVKEELKPYENMVETEQKREQLKAELIEYETEISGLKAALSSNSELLIRNSKLSHPEILLAVNSAFRLTSDSLTDEQITYLNQFTELFKIKESQAFLGEIPFGLLPEETTFSRQDIENKLEVKEQAKRKVLEDIAKLDKVLSDNWQQSYQELVISRDRTKKDLKLLREVAPYFKEHLDDLKGLEEEQKQNIALGEQITATKTQAKEHHEVVKKIQGKLDSLYSMKASAESIESKLNSLKTVEKYQPKKESKSADVIEQPHQGHLQNVENLFKRVSDAKNLILKGLNILVTNNIVEDANSLLMSSSPSFNSIYKGLFADCQAIYEALENDEKQLNELAKAHGQVTLDLTKTLSHQISHFENYIKRLTKELNTFKLSNIDAMRLDLTIEPGVTAFIESVNSLGVGADDALNVIEKGLFNQVRKFLTAMGIQSKDEFVLTGLKLVKSVRLEYQMNGKWEKKSGSTGTSLTSSAMLLSLFIQEMMGKDYSLSIPLNVDETSNLDFSNLENIYQFIQDRNLILFSASPDIPLCADEIFECFINLDDTDVFDETKLVSEEFRSTYHYQLEQAIEV
ncbi:hypothetical protein PALB_10290 [Pseudoalteromonas luteoviolacea B = ATCC 29581]|nr:hypothetical protein PALB_10290 [Pseudoalteromonas luteoviolacea B = ATCC 29581]